MKSNVFCASMLFALVACTQNNPIVLPDMTVPVLDLSGTAQDLPAFVDMRMTPMDMGSADFKGVSCGTQTCSGLDICCSVPGGSSMCASSCDDGGIAFGCDGPEDCGGATPACCGVLSLGAGTAPFCPINSGAAMCTPSCTTAIPSTCPGTGAARLCHQTADCAATPTMPKCCTFSASGTNVTVCVDQTYSLFATSCAP